MGKDLKLDRFEDNPIIRPRPEHVWESKATFNPAAIYEGGKVHILYRAIGDSDTSVLGYASSSEGFEIEERLSWPVYIPREPFEGVATTSLEAEPGIGAYASGGGGFGGCEDPRLTRLDDRIFMAYVAYDGRSGPRAALSWIKVQDFLDKRWCWSRPVLISPPGVINKNASILPEKINGKYVIFHRIFPDIYIDMVDDLDFDGQTKWLSGQFKIRARPDSWGSRKIGAGPPPIKTEEGWLLIYHGVDESDEYRYKIGAMLLDLDDPTKVIARCKEPVLSPEAWYENEGLKYGVIYPCGAVVLEGRLIVYYGSADKFVSVAWAPLDEFLERLLHESV
jgi:predicted GH43/DUF377 family glycosyl hydrolase